MQKRTRKNSSNYWSQTVTRTLQAAYNMAEPKRNKQRPGSHDSSYGSSENLLSLTQHDQQQDEPSNKKPDVQTIQRRRFAKIYDEPSNKKPDVQTIQRRRLAKIYETSPATLNTPGPPPPQGLFTSTRCPAYRESPSNRETSPATSDTPRPPPPQSSVTSTRCPAYRESPSNRGHGLSSLEARCTISTDGGLIQIPETAVILVVPPLALTKKHGIELRVIQNVADVGGRICFTGNSATIIELLPDGLEFQRPVELILPHCLKLRKGYSKGKVEILMSHHEKGSDPIWESIPDIKYELHDDTCIISLNTFCWITYKIEDKYVEGKRLKIFTAGRKLQTIDRMLDVEVGYCMDLPGNGEILKANKGLIVGQWKPFLFLKDDANPLEIKLYRIIPKRWTCAKLEDMHQTISYRSVSIANEESCPFIIQRVEENGGIPLCIFKVYQGNEAISITYRPEIERTSLNDLIMAENEVWV